MAFAAAQNREGKKDLAEFICNRGGKAVEECIAVAMELSTAKGKYASSQKTRLQLLHEMGDGQCIEGCHGQWLQAANYVFLRKNEIEVSVFFKTIF